MNSIIMAASNISPIEMKSNRMYFSVSMRMFSTRPNRNNEAVTEAFIDEIINNKQDYICMPLCVDVSRLERRDTNRLTHLYDPKTNQLMADEIGSFYDFKKVNDEYGVSLIGYARINKRTPAVTEMVQKMFRDHSLYFSFEIAAGKLREENGVTVVDADPENQLTAMTIVTTPAYPESTALSMVAELRRQEMEREMDEERKEDVVERLARTLRKQYGERADELECVWLGKSCALLFDRSRDCFLKMPCTDTEDDMDVGEPQVLEIDHSNDELTKEGSETSMDKPMEAMDEKKAMMPEDRVVVEKEAKVQTTEVQEKPMKEPKAEGETREMAEDMPGAKKEPVQETKAEPESKPEDAAPKANDGAADAGKPDGMDLEKEVETLRARCKTMEAELEQIKKERMTAEADAKRTELRDFAKAQGLNLEDAEVADAIESMNYEKLVKLMTAVRKQCASADVKIASFSDINSASYSYLFEKG